MSGEAKSGPLAGVRVIDITAVMMGPFATQFLADLGADVIKVEAPKGDSTRNIGPGSDEKMGPIYLGLNRNKRSIVLDLKTSQGRDALLRLIETADVVAYNVRPQAMKRLKLSYEDVAAVNPRIIYVGMFGFSQRGRYARSPAFDDLIQTASGLVHAIEQYSGSPSYVPANVADRTVGVYAFGVISAALYAREKTGMGQRIDVPMFETMVPYFLGDHLYGEKFIPARGGFGYPRLLSSARHPYRTKDAHVCCLIYHDHHWEAFLRVIGKSEMWESDPRLRTLSVRIAHATELNEFVGAELAKKTTAEWRQLLTEADIPVFPVHTFQSLLDDPHLADLGFFHEVEHPHVGTIRETAIPSEWHGTPPKSYRPAPLLGEHSAALLTEAGYSESEINAMIEAGVTAEPASVGKMHSAKRAKAN